jgi:hypothetical protein
LLNGPAAQRTCSSRLSRWQPSQPIRPSAHLDDWINEYVLSGPDKYLQQISLATVINIQQTFYGVNGHANTSVRDPGQTIVRVRMDGIRGVIVRLAPPTRPSDRRDGSIRYADKADQINTLPNSQFECACRYCCCIGSGQTTRPA